MFYDLGRFRYQKYFVDIKKGLDSKGPKKDTAVAALFHSGKPIGIKEGKPCISFGWFMLYCDCLIPWLLT